MADLPEQLDTIEQRLADGAVRLLQQWHLVGSRRMRGEQTDGAKELLNRLSDSQQRLLTRREELREELNSIP